MANVNQAPSTQMTGEGITGCWSFIVMAFIVFSLRVITRD
jgi:hypothetical protein